MKFLQATGNTALHVAAKNLSLNLVRTLLVFDAKTGIKNLAGHIPFEEAIPRKDGSTAAEWENQKRVLHSFIKIGAEVTELKEPIDFSDLEETDDYKRVRTLFSDFLNAQCPSRNNITGRRGRILSLDAGITDQIFL